MYNARIIPKILDKSSNKEYNLMLADYDNDYCRGMDPEYPNVIFHFKLHNVDIRYKRIEQTS